MKITSIIKIFEIGIFIIPGLLLSGIWVIWMAAVVVEEIQEPYEYLGFKGLAYLFIHLGLSVISHTAVWQLLLAACKWDTNTSNRGIVLRKKQLILILAGIVITGIGLISSLWVTVFNPKGDFFQVFPLYSIGVVVLIPALHFVIAHKANTLSQQNTANTSV